MQIDSLEEKLIYELNVIYDAEKHFLEAQQHRVRQTRIEPLIRMLVQHINETRQQIENLRLVFKLIDYEPKPIMFEVVTGLIAEAQTRIQQTAIDPEILEAVIVEAQIKMKDFEITCYYNLIKGIEQLGQTVIFYLIIENLRQEEQTLEQLKQYFCAILTR